MSAFKLFKKADILLLLFWGLLALGLFLFSLYGIQKGSSGGRLTVIFDNEVYGEYDLNEDQTIVINEGNTCEIRDGRVRMTGADCPDKVCVRSRAISRAGESIVCLPNHVILKITAGSDNDGIDTIAE